MARTVRDYRLESRAARSRLGQRAEPYWMLLSEGFHLGYYRGKQAAKWVARHRAPGQGQAYKKTTLGEADDTSDADGVRILDYRQAQDRAREWLRAVEGAVAVTANFTVGDALDEYIKAFTKKDLVNTKRRVEQFVRPAPRPVYSPLDTRLLRLALGWSPRVWEEALSEYIGLPVL